MVVFPFLVINKVMSEKCFNILILNWSAKKTNYVHSILEILYILTYLYIFYIFLHIYVLVFAVLLV